MSRPLPEKRPPFPPTTYRRKRKSLYIKCFLSFIVGGKVGGMVGGKVGGNAGEIPCGPYLGASAGEKHSSRGPSLAPSLLEAHAPRPQFGAFRVGASAPCSLRFGPRVGTLGIEPPPELLRHPRGQKSSRRPLGRWRLPRAHFKNHFENRPLPFANAQTAKHPRGPNFHKRSRGTPPERRPISKTKSELPIFRSSPAARYPLAFSLSRTPRIASS